MDWQLGDQVTMYTFTNSIIHRKSVSFQESENEDDFNPTRS